MNCFPSEILCGAFRSSVVFAKRQATLCGEFLGAESVRHGFEIFKLNEFLAGVSWKQSCHGLARFADSASFGSFRTMRTLQSTMNMGVGEAQQYGHKRNRCITTYKTFKLRPLKKSNSSIRRRIRGFFRQGRVLLR